MPATRETAYIEVSGVTLYDVATGVASSLQLYPCVALRRRQQTADQIRVIPRIPGIPGDPNRTVVVTDLGDSHFGLEWKHRYHGDFIEKLGDIKVAARANVMLRELVRTGLI